MDRKETIGNRLAPQIDKRAIDKGRPRKRRLASSRAVQDERPFGKSYVKSLRRLKAHAVEKWKCAHFEQRASPVQLVETLRRIFKRHNVGCWRAPRHLLAVQSAKSASRGTKCHGVRDARSLQDLRSLRKTHWQCCGEAAHG